MPLHHHLLIISALTHFPPIPLLPSHFKYTLFFLVYMPLPYADFSASLSPIQVPPPLSPAPSPSTTRHYPSLHLPHNSCYYYNITTLSLYTSLQSTPTPLPSPSPTRHHPPPHHATRQLLLQKCYGSHPPSPSPHHATMPLLQLIKICSYQHATVPLLQLITFCSSFCN